LTNRPTRYPTGPQGLDCAWPRFGSASQVCFENSPALRTLTLPAPKGDEPPPDGIQAVEARHRLYTTNLQNIQLGWSRRSAGDAPTERTSRASPSSASLGVRRISVPRGKRDHCLYLLPYRRWRVICASNLAQGRAAARVPDKPRQALSRGAPNVHL
jgi:hypothetical protein